MQSTCRPVFTKVYPRGNRHGPFFSTSWVNVLWTTYLVCVELSARLWRNNCEQLAEFNLLRSSRETPNSTAWCATARLSREKFYSERSVLNASVIAFMSSSWSKRTPSSNEFAACLVSLACYKPRGLKLNFRRGPNEDLKNNQWAALWRWHINGGTWTLL